MLKTLGGDRLGAGKKMKVDLHGYERSTHNQSYLWRSTMSAGTLVPFLCEVALPGDTWDISLGCEIMTHPTVGPLFGSYKVQLDVFQAPIRLYNGLLHNNALGIGLNMAQIKLPQIQLTAPPTQMNWKDLDNSQINPSCLLSYLGIRGVGINPEIGAITRNFNALGILSYWDIYKNYYSNKQEEIGAVIHTPFTAIITTVDFIQVAQPPSYSTDVVIPVLPATGAVVVTTASRVQIGYTGTTPLPEQIMVNTIEHGLIPLSQVCPGGFLDDSVADVLTGYGVTLNTVVNWTYATADESTREPKVVPFPLTNLDDMRKEILKFDTPGTPFVINTDTALEPYIWLGESAIDVPNMLQTQEGLALKTYQSDLFNNWLSTEWIDGTNGISEITSIDTSGGNFKIDTLILAKKVYNMLNRIAVSGGTYDDWLDAVYDHPRYLRCETPMYMGGLIKELVFQEVVSNSASGTGEENQPLGTLGGRGVLAQKHKGGDVIIKVDEPSYILGIISLTPRIDYSQGNKWDVNLQSLDDLHKPGLDEIGFQELITEQMAWWDTQYNAGTTSWVQKSAGKQPAWINYMTNVNQTRGNFAITTEEMFMTLNRRYEVSHSSVPSSIEIKDLTTYIDPVKYNFIFAETQLDAQNFWAQIAIDITSRKKMSAKLMPNL